ncbi:hypothetical protein FACS1894191_6270 [Clostridia bacterium]|nr:hypothetical protein FACS1894191_6270 [Clostridia bacterium]
MKKYGAKNLRIFGSVATGTANKNSDLDFLVDLPGEKYKVYMSVLGLENEFREIFGTENIDLSSPKTIRKEVYKTIKETIAV